MKKKNPGYRVRREGRGRSKGILGRRKVLKKPAGTHDATILNRHN